MAARKRRTTRRRVRRHRANPVNPVNPTRRHARRRRRHSVFARRRRNPINPSRRRIGRRRRYGRRRNPAGILGRAFTLAAGGALVGLVQPFVGRFVLPYVGVSPLTNAALAFGTGWLLSLAAGMTTFTRRFKDDLLLAGGVVGAAQLISAYVVPQIRARMAPAAQNGGMGWPGQGYGGNRWRNGMGGIALVTGTPPLIAAPPPPPPAGAGAGMNGMSVRPGYPGY